jgi:hypothetical protein
MLSHERRSVDGALAKSIGVEHEEHRAIGRGSKGDMSILRDESSADVVGGCIVLPSDGGVREMIEVRHIDEQHVDINGLGAHRLLMILDVGSSSSSSIAESEEEVASERRPVCGGEDEAGSPSKGILGMLVGRRRGLARH